MPKEHTYIMSEKQVVAVVVITFRPFLIIVGYSTYGTLFHKNLDILNIKKINFSTWLLRLRSFLQLVVHNSRNMLRNYFSEYFITDFSRFKTIGYKREILHQTVCLTFNPSMVLLFSSKAVGRAQNR